MKRVIALVLALTVLGLTVFAGSAEAASEPTPNGVCGAVNMMASDAMASFFAEPPSGPMVRNTTQGTHGNDGMFHAVDVSGCS